MTSRSNDWPRTIVGVVFLCAIATTMASTGMAAGPMRQFQVEAACRTGEVKLSISLSFSPDKSAYGDQLKKIRAEIADAGCRLIDGPDSTLGRAQAVADRNLRGDLYVSLVIFAEGVTKPWADVHLADECMAMLGDQGVDVIRIYRKTIQDIRDYSAKLKAMDLDGAHGAKIANYMDAVHGELAYCASTGSPKTVDALLGHLTGVVTVASAFIQLKLDGAPPSQESHFISTGDRGGGSSPPLVALRNALPRHRDSFGPSGSNKELNWFGLAYRRGDSPNGGSAVRVLGIHPSSKLVGQIQPDDLIMSVNGSRTEVPEDLWRVLERLQAGTSVELEVLRAGTERSNSVRPSQVRISVRMQNVPPAIEVALDCSEFGRVPKTLFKLPIFDVPANRNPVDEAGDWVRRKTSCRLSRKDVASLRRLYRTASQRGTGFVEAVLAANGMGVIGEPPKR